MEKLLSNTNDLFINNLMKIIINKFEQKEIKIEEVLENDFYLNDLIKNKNSEFKILLTKENIKQIIKFCLFPEKNPKKSQKYSYFSYKILCSECGLLFKKSIKLIIGNSNVNVNNNSKDKSDLENYIYPNHLKNNYKKDIWYFFLEDFYEIEQTKQTKYVDLFNVQFNEIEIQKKEIDKGYINNYNKQEIAIIMEMLDEIFKILDYDFNFENEIYLGYFQKLVNFLLFNESDIIIYYLFKDKIPIIKKLYKHLNNLSLQNILENILNIINAHEDKFDKEKNSKYIIIIRDLLEELIQDDTFEKSEYICNLIINTIIANNEKQLIELFFDNNIMEKIKKIIETKIKIKCNDKIIIGIIKILIELNDIIMKSCNNKSFQNYKNDFIVNKIKINIFEYKYFKKNNITSNIFQAFNKNSYSYLTIINEIFMIFIKDFKEKDINNKNFGRKYLCESNFILNALKIYIFSINENIDINDSQKYFYDEDLFTTLFEYYFSYPNNNLYQNIFKDIIKLICNEKCPKYLVELFLKSDKKKQNQFIYKLINNIIEESNNPKHFLLMQNLEILKIIYESSNKYFLNHFEESKLDNHNKEIFCQSIKPKMEMKLDYENYEYSDSEIYNCENDCDTTFDGNDPEINRQFECFNKTILKYSKKLNEIFKN